MSRDSSPAHQASPDRQARYEHPSLSLLRSFKTLKYTKYAKRCIADRQKLGFGKSSEMNTLFRFWSVFLRSDFRDRMYADFRKYAEEDAGVGQYYGLECLLRFYSCCKLTAANHMLYQDFESSVLRYYNMGNLYGLRMLCRFHESELADGKGAVSMGPTVKRLVDKLGKDLLRPSSATITVPQHRHATGPHLIPAAPPQSCSASARHIPPPSPPAYASPMRKPQLRPDARPFVCSPVTVTLPDRLGFDLGD